MPDPVLNIWNILPSGSRLSGFHYYINRILRFSSLHMFAINIKAIIICSLGDSRWTLSGLCGKSEDPVWVVTELENYLASS